MDPVAILKNLIAVPSVNPMGRDVLGPEFYETALTEHLGRFFDELGVPHECVEVFPGRANIIAKYEAADSEITVLLDAHQDTVPVDGMTIDPFDPVEKDGRIYGRGACDVKGGMASMLAAFARLVKEKPAGSASVIMSCSCDEEAAASGVTDLVNLWTDPNRAGTLLEHRPDVAVVAEPTNLDIVVAHRGATRWKIKTTGRACHSSQPSDGINAIYRMAKVVDCLERFADILPASITPHPLCGSATLSVGRIEGGISVNTVPDVCTIEIDRRVIPGEDGLGVMDDVAAYLAEHLDFEFEMLPPWIIGTTLSDSASGEWTDHLLGVISEVAGEHRKMGVPYGTNASRISNGGVPSMVFGPGSIAQAHTKDEWVPIDELQQASEVYYRFCTSVVKRETI